MESSLKVRIIGASGLRGTRENDESEFSSTFAAAWIDGDPLSLQLTNLDSTSISNPFWGHLVTFLLHNDKYDSAKLRFAVLRRHKNGSISMIGQASVCLHQVSAESAKFRLCSASGDEDVGSVNVSFELQKIQEDDDDDNETAQAETQTQTQTETIARKKTMRRLPTKKRVSLSLDLDAQGRQLPNYTYFMFADSIPCAFPTTPSSLSSPREPSGCSPFLKRTYLALHAAGIFSAPEIKFLSFF